jgi:ABC-type bacteriocin/lantibiotic exporter with double-glycine peptidase domain
LIKFEAERFESADLAPLVEEAAVPALAVDETPIRARSGAVPFRTQRDGSRFAGSNCGPAALAMVLEAYGLSFDNDHLRYLSHTYQGTWDRRGGTALEHLAQVAEDFGVGAKGLYRGSDFRRWTVAEVRAEVAAGHPVIVLVKYRLLPGREQSTVRYDHYVVLWDVTADGFVYNDPIYPEADEGFARRMSDAQLEAAMRPTMHPQQAVAFVGGAS